LASLHRLNGLTISVGPSSAFYLKPSSHTEAVASFDGNHKSAKVFPKFGKGYYLHCQDLQINLVFRNISRTIVAYGFEQSINREALTMEGCKFFMDYQGFVPLVGISISNE